MSSFVSIKTVSNRIEDRNIDYLKGMYNNFSGLLEVINTLVKEDLPKHLVFGKRVLIKPNWVMHDCRDSDKICLRTHDNFTLATLEVILQKNPKKIIIGDAPIQSCHWDQLLSKEFLAKVDILKKKYEIPIEIRDFRRTTFDPKQNNPQREINPISEYVIFDLGKESYLEPISIDKLNLFRVTDYSHDHLAESHRPGVHKYCITKELFDCDLIISLPKVKTHQKAGLTNALKNIVGLNGDKDFLPHHRFGGTKKGGDCYPGNNILLHWAELTFDIANRNQGKFGYHILRKFAFRLWRLSFPSKYQNLGAAWYGNDTTWRMVMDINLIAEYGRKDGTLSKESQRVLFSLSDGIIGGQGNGPLRPEPLPLGIICFSNSSTNADIAMSYLMGFDYDKIPLLKAADEKIKGNVIRFKMNDEEIELKALNNYSIKTNPPKGWMNYL
jgi:uncharacterized protein (DUF362 family)